MSVLCSYKDKTSYPWLLALYAVAKHCRTSSPLLKEMLPLLPLDVFTSPETTTLHRRIALKCFARATESTPSSSASKWYEAMLPALVFKDKKVDEDEEDAEMLPRFRLRKRILQTLIWHQRYHSVSIKVVKQMMAVASDTLIRVFLKDEKDENKAWVPERVVSLLFEVFSTSAQDKDQWSTAYPLLFGKSSAEADQVTVSLNSAVCMQIGGSMYILSRVSRSLD